MFSSRDVLKDQKRKKEKRKKKIHSTNDDSDWNHVQEWIFFVVNYVEPCPHPVHCVDVNM